jgi:hypothetical protein
LGATILARRGGPGKRAKHPTERKHTMSDEREQAGKTQDAAGQGGADVTGGADKAGRRATSDTGEATEGESGARESGDISGASSTHAGAGGVMENTGGTGTAPVGDI